MSKFNELLKLFREDISKVSDDQTICLKYVNFIESHILSNPNPTLEILEEGIYQFKNHKNPFYYYWLLFNKIVYFLYKNDFEYCYKPLIECIAFFKSIKHEEFYLRSLGNLVIIYERFGLYNHLITLKKEILFKAIAIESPYLIAMTKINIIIICDKLNKLDTIDSSNIIDVCNICEEQSKKYFAFYQPLAYSYLLLAKKELIQNKYDNCKNYIDKSKEVIDKIDDQVILFQYYCTLNFYLNKLNLNRQKDELYYNIHKFLKKNESFGFYDKDLFNSLYKFYWDLDEFELAIFFKELSYSYFKKLSQEEIRLMEQMHKLNLSNEFQYVNFQKLSKYNFFDYESIQIYNLKNELEVVVLEKIIYIEALNKNIRIYFSNNKIEYYKLTLKAFYSELEKKNQNILFIFSNKRTTLINLYWYLSFNKKNYTITLYNMDQFFHFKITKRQILYFKKLNLIK